MGRWLSIVAAVATIIGASGARAAEGAKIGSVTFSRLVQKLPPGQPWLSYQEGLFCKTRQTVKADGAQTPVSIELYGPLFVREFAAAGLGKDEATNLFAEAPERRDSPAYEIGGLVHGMDVKVCAIGEGLLNDLRVKGSGQIEVQWQVYSPAKRAVVATIETVGSMTLKNTGYRLATDVPKAILADAFADAARKLAASPELKALMAAPAPKDEIASTPGQQIRISAVTGGPKGRPVAESTGSVVLVVLPDGHGSGVLVSADGYLLTNAHVVGQHKTVKIRWSDGFETQGEVVRVHVKRDVALVKTDSHGRTPLPTRLGQLQPGDTVLAIGAPLDEQLQGTVSRGIVSANRIMDGYSFIQSDVMVNHGNSGGALIDDKGFLVGLTDIGRVSADGSPVGLNFFIPIKDALDFLSLDLVPSAAPPPAPKTAAPVATR